MTTQHANLHSSPAINAETLQNAVAELEEEDKEEEEEVKRTVTSATFHQQQWLHQQQINNHMYVPKANTICDQHLSCQSPNVHFAHTFQIWCIIHQTNALINKMIAKHYRTK